MSDILTELAKKVGLYTDAKPAPVHLWSPEFCGEIDLEIKNNGEWHYMGSQIKRRKLVALFASVLWRDVANDGAHYLVTPVEKIKIKVNDAAFLASEILVRDSGDQQNIAIQTNLAGQVMIGRDHLIRFSDENDQFMAYVSIRYGLEAKLTRALCFELADYLTENNGKFYLLSDGQRFDV